MSEGEAAVVAGSSEASTTEVANAGIAHGSFDINLGPNNAPDPQIAEKARREFESFVPEEYRDKEWFKNTTKAEDPKKAFFSQFENAQSMVGKSGVQPLPDNATPEQTKAFYKSLGVPDSTEAYKLEAPQWGEADKPLAEFIEKSRTPEFMDAIKKAAMENGVTPKQLQALMVAHDKTAIETNREAFQAETKQQFENDKYFINEAQRLYGSNWETVMGNAQQIIRSTADPTVVAHLESLDPKALILLASVTENIRRKYISEDSFSTKNNSQVPALTTRDSLIAEGERLMSSAAYNDFNHAEHDAVRAQVTKIYRDPRILPGK